MKYITKNDNYTIYEDYSVSVRCQKCGKIDNLKPDHPQAIKINQMEDAGNNYLCLDCWKKQQDEKWEAIKNEKRSDIILGQAFNKAVDTIIALYPDELKRGGENAKELLKSYSLAYKNLLVELYESKNNSNL